jgi:uncharacterized membrane protein
MIPFHVIIYAILFVLVDAIYLTNIAGPYGKMISNIQGEKMVMKIMPAVVVYLSLIGAWYVFIYRERKGRSYWENVGRAALLGFFIYSVYDFTNLALINKYQLDLSLIDSVWGGLLYGITTAILLRL